MTPDAITIRHLQETGINWYGEPLAIDNAYGPETQWWHAISQLEEKRVQIVKDGLVWYKQKTKEDAGKPNRGDRVDKFVQPGGVGLGVPWCIAFTSYVLKVQNGLEIPYHMSAYALIEWATKHGRLTDDPKPGDRHAFLYPDSKSHEGHGGIVLGANADWILCVDGNCGDAVKVGTRARRGLKFISSFSDLHLPTMPPVKDLIMLDGTRALTR